MSKTHVDELFQGISTLDEWLEINTLETGVFWNDEGRFQWQPLPVESQLTPAMSLAVSDFNGDGRSDIFIGQNLQSLQPEISRYDAGLGLILLADGVMGFRALTAEESGIRLTGEQTEALATDWNGDGLMDLLVGQTAGDFVCSCSLKIPVQRPSNGMILRVFFALTDLRERGLGKPQGLRAWNAPQPPM
jgi:hypothetical protein